MFEKLQTGEKIHDVPGQPNTRITKYKAKMIEHSAYTAILSLLMQGYKFK